MKRQIVALLSYFLLAVTLSAQNPNTGLPVYGSFSGDSFDAINLQNLNAHFAIPIVSSNGRGSNFNFALTYDSLVWMQVQNGSTTVWTPVLDHNGLPGWGWQKDVPLGFATWTTTTSSFQCPRDGGGFYTGTKTIWSNYFYTDFAGTRHPFNVSVVDICDNGASGSPGYATDNSQYYIDPTAPDSPVVYSPKGQIVTTTNKMTDANGNFSSGSTVGSVTTWTDTANHAALLIDRTNSAYTDYKVLDPSGAYQTYRLTYSSSPINIKTNFGCSGVTEYTGSATLPISLGLPNGKTYQFQYEDYPDQINFPGYKTGRLSKVTLPIGGYYQYSYPTTGHYGTNCADSSMTNLTRVINDSSTSVTWQFDRAPNGSNWNTTVTAPQLSYDTAQNQTVLTFNSAGQEITKVIYQGSASSGTLLRTINTTWSGVAPATRVTILENNQQSKTAWTYDSYGNISQLDEYDWGTGAPPSTPTRTTNITYLTTTAYIARNMLNFPTLVTIKDGTGTIQSRAAIAYDESGYINTSCPTGVAQHDDTYSCTYTTRGLATTVTKYTTPATPSGPISKHFSYDFFGNLVQADLNCCQHKTWNYSATTQYASPDSIVRGSSSPQLTTSATYNAYTGQVATTTDENSGQTTFTYSDPGHLNRLTDVLRPDNQHVTYAYDDTARTVTVTSPVQTGASVKQVNYFDGLGRPIKQQVTDNGGTSYSIAESQYDVLGRPYRVSNPHNSSAQYWNENDFDALGRPTASKVLTSTYSVTSGNTTTYLYAGPAATVTDPAGKQKESVVDGLGRLVTVYEPDVANGNALTQQTAYSYNS